MSSPPNLTDVQGVLDHGIKDVHLAVTLDPTNNNSATIKPHQLLMSCGVKDHDHKRISKIVVDNAQITGDAHGVCGLVFSGDGTLPTSHRITHVDGTQTATSRGHQNDCVHAIATSASLAHPITIPLGPSEKERASATGETVKMGIARAARWQGQSAASADIHDDCSLHERGSEKRYVIPSNADSPNASLVTKFWENNKSNPDFLKGKYMSQKRTAVNGGFVVDEADFLSAKEVLKSNLSPKSPFAEKGLTVTAIPLIDGQHTPGQVHVRMRLVRDPLTKEAFEAKAAPEHESMLTVEMAKTFLGEDIANSQLSESTSDGKGVATNSAEVFAAKI